MIYKAQFILYVADQSKSKTFYQKVLQIDPVLDVPGMTEFELATNTKLGLMPETGIAKIIADNAPHPALANGIPRCELYLLVNDVQPYIIRAIENHAKLISKLENRDWEHKVAYFADPDGHIIAFAENAEKG